MSRRHLLGGMMAAPVAPRLIDPVEQIERGADENHGIITPRSLTQRQDAQERFTAESSRTQRYIVFETIEMHKYSVPANTTSQMTHLLATSATTVGVSGTSPDVGQQCRVAAVRLLSSGAVTAGTAALQLTVFEDGVATDYLFDECELNTTDTLTKSLVLSWEQSPQVAKNATWYLLVKTSAAFAPAATLNMKAHITFAYEQWI